MKEFFKTAKMEMENKRKKRIRKEIRSKQSRDGNLMLNRQFRFEEIRKPGNDHYTASNHKLISFSINILYSISKALWIYKGVRF